MTLAFLFDSVGFGEWFVAAESVQKTADDAFTVADGTDQGSDGTDKGAES